MNTLFKNSKNSKTSDPHRLLLNLSDKKDLKIGDKYAALLNLSIFCTWKNIKTSNKNNKLKISGSKWSEKPEVWSEKPEVQNGSYSVSDFKISLCISSKNMKQLQGIISNF